MGHVSLALENQQVDQNMIDRKAACLRLAQAKYCQEIMNNASTTLKNNYNNTVSCITTTIEWNKFALSHANDSGSLTQFVDTTFGGYSPSISHTFFTNKSVVVAKTASKSCYTPPASLEVFEELHTVDGVWRIQTEKDQVVWLGFNQTQETATCLGTNPDTYEFWVRNTGCRIPLSDHILSAGPVLWLMPTSLTQFECSEGEDLSYFDVYSGFKTAAQQKEAKPFLRMKVASYADLFAKYTAILGALFGAVTILIASIIVAIVQSAARCSTVNTHIVNREVASSNPTEIIGIFCLLCVYENPGLQEYLLRHAE